MRITFFANYVNNLISSKSERMNGDGITVIKPQRYCCSKLPACSVQLIESDCRVAHVHEF